MDYPKKIILGGSLGGGILLLFIFFYFTWWRYIESTDNAYVQADISVISAKLTGYVQDILIKANQSVKEGDLLVRLESEEFKAKVKEAEASIALANAVSMNVKARLDLQHSTIQQAQGVVEEAQAELTRSQKEYERALSLVSRQFMSSKQLEQIQASYKKAQASLKSARAAHKAAQLEIPVLETEYEQNKAKLAQAEAEKCIAQDNLEHTHLWAPVEGVIGNKLIQPGQLVRPGQQLMVVVPTQAYIYANFKETQVESMRKGQKVTITLDAYPSQEFSGYIESLAPASGAVFSLFPPENATGNFTKIVQRMPVKIVFDPPPSFSFLRPGLSAKVKVNTKERRG